MFCVECGTEGPTVEGLCLRCFSRKYRVVDPPDHVDVPRCKQCGALQIDRAWIRTDLDPAIPQVLREAMPVRKPFARALFTHEAREEDANNYSLSVKATASHEGFEVVQGFQTRLRLKPSLCDICGKQRGHYYEGIVQVRAQGRAMTPKEIRAVRTFVMARADRLREASREFVSRIEETPSGLDAYVSTNALSKALAREIAEAFGGSVTTSSKLFGRRGGKELYRITNLVRLSPFQVGDVVRHKDALAEVTKIATLVTLRDLTSGEERRYKPKDLRGVLRIDAERFEADLERTAEGETAARHPDRGASRPILTRGPPKRGHAVVVWTAEGVFLSSLPADISKG